MQIAPLDSDLEHNKHLKLRENDVEFRIFNLVLDRAEFYFRHLRRIWPCFRWSSEKFEISFLKLQLFRNGKFFTAPVIESDQWGSGTIWRRLETAQIMVKVRSSPLAKFIIRKLFRRPSRKVRHTRDQRFTLPLYKDSNDTVKFDIDQVAKPGRWERRKAFVKVLVGNFYTCRTFTAFWSWEAKLRTL